MTTIVTRTGKGSPLTHVEVDTNFTNLNTAKLEAGAIALGSAAAPSISFTGGTDGIYSPGAGTLAVSTAGVERYRTDSAGRLLVGTSTARSNFYTFTTTHTPQIQFETVTNSWSNGLSLLNYSASGYAPILTIGSSSSNTQGTNTALGASGGFGFEMGAINFSGNNGTDFRTGASISAVNDSNTAWTSGSCPTRLVFSTTANGAASPTERMRIGNAGVINLNSGTVKFNASGYTEISVLNDSNANGFVFDAGDGGAGNRPKFKIRYGTADQIYLDGNGTAEKPGGGSWAAISDLRSKEDVVDYTSGLDQLKQIQPRYYRYIGNENTYIGLVAQEVEDAMPELVKQGEGTLPDGTEVTDFRTLDQTPLTFALINAVKEMAATIEALEADVAALKGA